MADHGPGDDDPARAFDALRHTVEGMARDLGGEMVVLRRGIEAAFDKLDTLQPAPNYSEDLARIQQELDGTREQLQAVAESPLLKQGAAHLTGALSRAGEGLMQSAAAKFERQAGDLERMTGNLGRQTARERTGQNGWLWSTGVTGLALGAFLALYLPRILPASVGAYAASVVLAEQPWQAGATLMRHGSPEGWAQMILADRLVRENAEAVAQCRKLAAETKKEQRCSVMVKPAG
jgi:hypothetical protein